MDRARAARRACAAARGAARLAAASIVKRDITCGRADICPHRGAPLHMGWVADVGGHDCVVCPYHGWAFDTEGVLRDVPAAEHGCEFPQKPLIDAFPVEERVWPGVCSRGLQLEFAAGVCKCGQPRAGSPAAPRRTVLVARKAARTDWRNRGVAVRGSAVAGGSWKH